MIRDFYYSLLRELKGLSYPSILGISRTSTGDYIVVQHVDAFAYDLAFDFINTDCYYQKVQSQIRVHSDTSKVKALEMSEEVRSLLNNYFFQIDYARIINVVFNSRIFISEGINDGFTYILTYTYWLGTDTQEMSSSSSMSSSSTSSSSNSSSSTSSNSSSSSTSSSISSNSSSSKSSVSSSSKSSASSNSSSSSSSSVIFSRSSASSISSDSSVSTSSISSNSSSSSTESSESSISTPSSVSSISSESSSSSTQSSASSISSESSESSASSESSSSSTESSTSSISSESSESSESSSTEWMSSSSSSSNPVGCQMFWTYTYTCGIGYTMGVRRECRDSINKEVYGWIVYEDIPGDHEIWIAADWFADEDCN